VAVHSRPPARRWVVGIAAGVGAQSYQFQRVVDVLRVVGFIHQVDKARGWLNDL
jgi:hypothetical protein